MQIRNKTILAIKIVFISIIITAMIFFIYCNKSFASEKKYITPEQFGAIGDGLSDDTKALQKAFRYARANEGIEIVFGKKKNYLISSGIVLPRISIVDGNNSTITINNIPDFMNGGNFQNQFFMEYEYNGHSYLLDWKDLNINFSPGLLLNENGEIKEYLLFRLHHLDCFKMKNVNIIYSGDERNNINLFKFIGQGKIYIDNCNFSVTHRGKVGSVLWIQSMSEEGYYARINNSTFYSTGWDEIISIFCNGSHDIEFNNCYIKKIFYDTYYNKDNRLETTTGPFINSVYQTPTINHNNTISHNVTYKDCTLICEPIDKASNVFIAFCGLNSYYGDLSVTKFYNCNICANNIDVLAGGEQSINNQFVTNIADNKEFHDKVKLVFDKCNIKINFGSHGMLKSNSSNVEIYNSVITTNKLLDYTWAEQKTVTSYQLKLINNDIYLNQTDNIFKVNKLAKEQYIIQHNNFYTTSLANFLSESISDDGYMKSTFTHNNNASYYFESVGNKLNYLPIKDFISTKQYIMEK